MAGPVEGAPTVRPARAVTSLYVWGIDRTEVNATARRVAARLDREYAWLETSERGDAPWGWAPGGSRDRSYPAVELLPRARLSEEQLWSYVQPVRSRDLGRDLLEFLRMSDPLQEAIAALLERPGPRVLALGNWDLLPDLPGPDRSAWAGLIEFLHRHEITLVAGATGHPLPERIDFEYSIATPEVLPQSFPTIAAVCQWGNCDDCVVNELFPRDEVVCINRLGAGRPSEEPNGMLPDELVLN